MSFTDSQERLVTIDRFFIAADGTFSDDGLLQVPHGSLLHRLDEAFLRLQSNGWRTAHAAQVGCCGHCEVLVSGIGPKRPRGIAFYEDERISRMGENLVRDRDAHVAGLSQVELSFDSTLPRYDPGYATDLAVLGAELCDVVRAVGLAVGEIHPAELSGHAVSVVAGVSCDFENGRRWRTCFDTV